MMKVLYYSVRLLAVVCILLPAFAQRSIQDICSSIGAIAACNAILTLPTGAIDIRQCRNKFFQFNGCKSHIDFSVPCPTIRKPFRKCHEQKCVPDNLRTDEVWVNTPCGLIVHTAEVNVCDKIRRSFPIADELMSKSTAMCKCLPQVLNLGGDATISNLDNADISSATSQTLSAYAGLSKCFIDNGFTVHDAKNDLEAAGGILSTSDGSIVIRAQEIDLASYITFAEAVALCAVVGKCDSVTTFFTDYLQKSIDLMSNELKSAVIAPWTNIVNTLNASMTIIDNELKVLPDRLSAMQLEIENIHIQLCQDVDSCVHPSVVSFYRIVSQTLAFGLDLANADDNIAPFIAAIIRMANILADTAAALDAIPDVQTLVQMVAAGQLNQINQIAQILKLGQELPKLVRQLKDNVHSGAAYTSDLASQVINLDDVFELALAEFWITDQSMVNASLADARDSITRVQAMLRNETEPIKMVVAQTKSALASLGKLPFHGRELIMDVRVASYQRWSDVSFNVLCSHTATDHFEQAGFKASFSYPAFETCPYGPQRIPWPNHHIPFVKFRFSG